MGIETRKKFDDNYEEVSVSGEKGNYIGMSMKWKGGQYVALQGEKGFVGCGIYDIEVAEEFGFAVAIAKGTPEKPLKNPKDLLQAKIIKLTSKAREYGIKEGMSGEEAIERLL